MQHDPSEVLGSCQRGDDQICPLELEVLRHDCDLGDQRPCERLERLKNEWVDSTPEQWALDRCAIGQWAACLVVGEKYLRRCTTADDARACAKLAELCEKVPGIAGAIDLDVAAVLSRACDLGHAESCSRFSEGGLGVTPPTK